jgi:hypothetical protein
LLLNLPASAASSTSADADFEARRTAPGVVRWFDFDSDAQLGSAQEGVNFGYMIGEKARPVIDSAVFASGHASLRFDVLSQTGANASGAWFANFSSDLRTQFGENSEFFVQGRQRFSDDFVRTYFTAAGSGGKAQGGIKQLIVTTGDQPGGRRFHSCEAVGNVVQTFYQLRFPIVYNSCTGSGSHGPFAGLNEEITKPHPDFFLENATSPPCRYSQLKRDATSTVDAPPGCFTWVANEWMTFQIGVTLGLRNKVTNDFDSSRVRLWAAREGRPSVLLIDWRPGIGGYFPIAAGPPGDDQRFGKVYLLPYMTDKDNLQVHPVGQTWYDELIISRQRIADPFVASKAAAPLPQNAVQGDRASKQPSLIGLPRWRRDKPVGKFVEIPGTANLSGAASGLAVPEAVIDAWNGLAAGPSSWWSAASGGHGVWSNATFELDLAVDAPRWKMVNAGSREQDVTTDAAYYRDGLPVSRHTYYSAQFIQSRHRIMLFGCAAPYGVNNPPPAFQGGKELDGFDVQTNQWDAAGSYDKIPIDFGNYVAQHSMPFVVDPRNEDVYAAANYQFAKWSAKTGKWTLIKPKGNVAPTAWELKSSLIDVKRNRWVSLTDGSPYATASGIRMQIIDLANYEMRDMPASGDVAGLPGSYSMLVHDIDNDRYLLATSNALYSIDPESGAVRRLMDIPESANGTYNRFAYFPALGGVAYLPRFSSNVLFMPTR